MEGLFSTPMAHCKPPKPTSLGAIPKNYTLGIVLKWLHTQTMVQSRYCLSLHEFPPFLEQYLGQLHATCSVAKGSCRIRVWSVAEEHHNFNQEGYRRLYRNSSWLVPSCSTEQGLQGGLLEYLFSLSCFLENSEVATLPDGTAELRLRS